MLAERPHVTLCVCNHSSKRSWTTGRNTGQSAMYSIKLSLRRCAALFVLFAVLLPVPAQAQRFKWWHADHVQRELGLTREQSARLEEIFQTSLPTLRKQKDTLDAAE